MTRPLPLLLTTAILVFLLDQATKYWVVQMLDLKNQLRIEVVPPFLVFQMAWNEGINFGIRLGGPWFLIALSVVISAGVGWWAIKRGTVVMALGAGLIIGGALGNAIDRIVYGAVADFLNMSCCGFQNPFSFNVADIAIFLGAIWIALKA